MKNYFNQLPLRKQVEQLGVCEFLDLDEFDNGVEALKGKKPHLFLAKVVRLSPSGLL